MPLLVMALVLAAAPPASAQAAAGSLAEAFNKAFGTSADPPLPEHLRRPDPPPRRLRFPSAADPASPASPTSAMSVPSHQFLLTGVVVTDRTQMAILQELHGGAADAPLLLRVGDAVNGYQLTTVEADRVTLTGPSGPVVVLLSTGGTPGPDSRVPGQQATPVVQRGQTVSRPPVEPAESVASDKKMARQEERLQKAIDRALGNRGANKNRPKGKRGAVSAPVTPAEPGEASR